MYGGPSSIHVRPGIFNLRFFILRDVTTLLVEKFVEKSLICNELTIFKYLVGEWNN